VSAEQKEQTTTRSSDASSEDNVRRPDQDIRRPRLRVKPVGSRDGSAPQQAQKRNGTLFEGDADAGPRAEEEASQGESPRPAQQTASDDSDGEQAAEPRKVVVPPLEGRYPYATYRSAPSEDEAEEAEERKAPGRTGSEREISAGFLLGVALVVVVLVGGIWLARLQNKVGNLEARISQLEGPQPAGSSDSP
jgi:cobalamin biosynthesis Mg chelatase CobN